MKTFFLILFFAKSVAITTEPIDISHGISFHLTEPISAITSGAHVRIDLTSSLVGTVDLSNTVSVLDYLREHFPNGSITGTLTAMSGETITLDWLGSATSGDDAKLILASSSGVPTDMAFSELKIDTSIELSDVNIIWQNHSK